ncbi:MAG: DMT family transporter [Halovenus sp.]|uniref:DMT family transporter n=1 Tax=Halovenus amylolytica TaxID=2500550 RepID=UPI000FE3DB59
MEAALGIAVLAAFVWGGYIYLLKRSFDSYSPAGLIVLVNIFAVGWYLPVVGYDGARVLESIDRFAIPELGITILASGMTAAATVLFLRALATGEVSYITPINKIVPVFVLPVEIVFLGQFLTPLQVFGVIVATLAVYVANYEPGGFFLPFIKAAHSRPAQLALLSAACFAISDVSRRVALQELAIAQRLYVPLLLVFVAVLLLPSAISNPPAVDRTDLPKFAFAGGLVAVGEHLTTIAFATLPASIASPIVNTQAIVAVVLGGILLGERHFRLRLLAAVLAVVGVTLLSV